eukprot:2606368-Pyramimonas_sp.AAC.1
MLKHGQSPPGCRVRTAFGDLRRLRALLHGMRPAGAQRSGGQKDCRRRRAVLGAGGDTFKVGSRRRERKRRV